MKELFQKVIDHARENETFKEELIANPIEAVEKFTGERITENDLSEMMLAQKVNAKEDVSLSEEQLTLVSGGKITPSELVDTIKGWLRDYL